jgi:hypothetical protein
MLPAATNDPSCEADTKRHGSDIAQLNSGVSLDHEYMWRAGLLTCAAIKYSNIGGWPGAREEPRSEIPSVGMESGESGVSVNDELNITPNETNLGGRRCYFYMMKGESDSIDPSKMSLHSSSMLIMLYRSSSFFD